MSASDIWLRDISTKYGFVIATILFLSLWINYKWSKLRNNIYTSYLLGFEAECAELAASYKRRLFRSLEQIVSHDETLRFMGQIRILEIGVKTGENIQYYPDGSQLIIVDWNRKLENYLICGKKSWQFSHVDFERQIFGDGSSLEKIPNGSVDAVVTTRSLCSTISVADTIHEIHRVLAPGGKYFFMEHIAENEGTFTRWIQTMLTRSTLWPSLYGFHTRFGTN
ncbi:putative methyltransferase-like protein 7A isoform X2 [Leptopilina boulardi]|uniref:putative methyltransferase-like protein 7A isoform X2 n=1 Tax=Leptopilina boulardi TaxID=63433 RepID=UPI0021F65DB5|nr:putative methyltransferase-like protein 7A isoform X2 [Leptopilina boulardi]